MRRIVSIIPSERIVKIKWWPVVILDAVEEKELSIWVQQWVTVVFHVTAFQNCIWFTLLMISL